MIDETLDWLVKNTFLAALLLILSLVILLTYDYNFSFREGCFWTKLRIPPSSTSNIYCENAIDCAESVSMRNERPESFRCWNHVCEVHVCIS